MAARTVLLRDLGPALAAALEELMSSDLDRRPFVIVSDTVTEQFVQFARRYKPKTGELLFDVPKLGVHLRSCATRQQGVEWAVKTFVHTFQLPGEAILEITLDGDPSN